MNLTFRPAVATDEPLLLRAYASTREAEMAMVPWDETQKQAFIRMQFTAQLTHYRTRYPKANHWILELEGQPAGMVYIDQRKTAVHLLDLIVLPEYRRRGIGTWVLRWCMEQAEQTERMVTGYLEQGSPTIPLVERLGFVHKETEGFHLLFSWDRKQASEGGV